MTRLIAIFTVCVGLLCSALPALGGDIHRAIEADDAALVKQILADDPGAIGQRDEGQFEELPIHIAATTGNVEIARLLLDAGAKVDAGDSDNSTALDVAAMRQHGEVVALLIERGANVNHRDRKADCPLSFAVYGRDEAIIQQLLDAGADLYFRNSQGETLLHIASVRGVQFLVEYVVGQGMEVDPRKDDGATPLCYAVMRGHADIARYLLENGASPVAAEGAHMGPLSYTIWTNQVECAGVLLEHGAKVDEESGQGNTPLGRAASDCSVEMVTLLVEKGADVNHANEFGTTPLVGASASGYADRVEVLLAANANPNKGTDRDGFSALQVAAVGGHTEVARMLISKGANLNTATPTGQTPLELAYFYGNNDLAALLIENGAASGGAERIDRSVAAFDKVGKKEAVVWFLGHSGWAVKTRNHLLVFDYFPQGEDPTNPGLSNGHIYPAEIADENVAVFASHSHGDHFSPAIFEWREEVTDITYFLGLEPQDAPAYEYMPERLEQSFGDIKLTTIHSTDAGVGMVVEVDGLTIFHAGDHANGRIGLMDEFTDEIDFLAAKKLRPDICLMGIRGCSLGRPDEVKEGVYYTLKTLEPRVFIPMHAGADGYAYHEFIDECRGEFKSIQMVAPDNRGDNFVYKDGKIIDPRPVGTRQARADG